jgi:membrane-bound metal-dependent hydrolase YbcI (DUF457 family)
MPFTPSHAVVALPFLRTPLVPAAIAVGAMSPDLPLFLRGMPLHYGMTHSLVWLPLTIAVALVLLLVWRGLLRPATRELAPVTLARRLPAEWDAGAGSALRETFARGGTPSRVSWRGAAILLVSLALGIVTHILWDLFTHEGRWGVQVLPLLDQPWGPLTGYKWLQHGSTVVGLAILAVWAALWLRRREPAAVRRLLPGAVRWTWWISLPAVLLVAWVMGLAAYGPLTDEWTVAHLAYRALPPACALWGMLTVLLALAVQVMRGSASRRDPQTMPADRDPSAAGR